MITEIDSYLIKCSLEALDEGVKPEEVEVECSCRLGLQTNNNNNKEE